MRSHVMFGLAASLFLLSCASDNNQMRVKAILQSLHNSNESIREKNRMIYNVLDDKMRKQQYQEKIKLWHPKAIEVQKMSKDLVAYIGQLK
ncbi:MAG: hypothetical protein WCF67_20405, partial [Chitinophagaceae bacterium]